MCSNEVVAEYPSPDRRMKVTVFERDCGATTGFSTQASLLGANRALPGGAGNIFIADGDHGAAPEGPHGGPEVDVHWLSDQEVIVRHHVLARVFKAEKRYDGVHFDYGAGL